MIQSLQSGVSGQGMILAGTTLKEIMTPQIQLVPAPAGRLLQVSALCHHSCHDLLPLRLFLGSQRMVGVSLLEGKQADTQFHMPQVELQFYRLAAWDSEPIIESFPCLKILIYEMMILIIIIELL